MAREVGNIIVPTTQVRTLGHRGYIFLSPFTNIHSGETGKSVSRDIFANYCTLLLILLISL